MLLAVVVSHSRIRRLYFFPLVHVLSDTAFNRRSTRWAEAPGRRVGAWLCSVRRRPDPLAGAAARGGPVDRGNKLRRMAPAQAA